MVKPCEICGTPTLPVHHKFSDSKPNKKKYGKNFIDSIENKQYACIECNSSHQMQGKGLIVWNEREFQEALDLMHCKYCYHTHIAEGSKSDKCLMWYGPEANECRFFTWDLNKYKELNK